MNDSGQVFFVFGCQKHLNADETSRGESQRARGCPFLSLSHLLSCAHHGVEEWINPPQSNLLSIPTIKGAEHKNTHTHIHSQPSPLSEQNLSHKDRVKVRRLREQQGTHNDWWLKWSGIVGKVSFVLRNALLRFLFFFQKHCLCLQCHSTLLCSQNQYWQGDVT